MRALQMSHCFTLVSPLPAPAVEPVCFVFFFWFLLVCSLSCFASVLLFGSLVSNAWLRLVFDT